MAELEPSRGAASSGARLVALIPSVGDVTRRIGGFRDSLRESIGTVGTSVGKLMRLSSR